MKKIFGIFLIITIIIVAIFLSKNINDDMHKSEKISIKITKQVAKQLKEERNLYFAAKSLRNHGIFVNAYWFSSEEWWSDLWTTSNVYAVGYVAL